MIIFKLLIFLVLEFICANCYSFEKNKIYDVTPVSNKDFLVLESLQQNIPGLKIWQHVHDLGHKARMLVPEESVDQFEYFLLSANVQFEVFTENLERNSKEAKKEIYNLMRDNSSISFTQYNRYSEINEYLDSLAVRYPSRVTVESGERTTNLRLIKIIKISSTGGTNQSRPIIVVDAGMVAREWLGPSVALYAITKLVENITESDVANNVDWIIVPLLNPDGYEFSHDTGARLWIKNRSGPVNTNCYGANVNRNFDVNWLGPGSNANPCSDYYAGSKPFSEVESRVIRDVIVSNEDRVKAYVSLHTYGSHILYPYGYDGSNASNARELQDLGEDMAFAINVYAAQGVHYEVGNSTCLQDFAASGTSVDWAKEVGVDLTYNLVLPGGGSAGHNLPPTYIDRYVKDTWRGFTTLAKYVIKKYT